MNKNFLLIASGLLVAALTLAVVLLVRQPAPTVAATADPALHFDQDAGTEERIRALEAAVAGLAEGCRVLRDVEKDSVLTYADIELPVGRLADELRAEQNQRFDVPSLA